MGLILSLALILVGIGISFYFYKRYSARSEKSEKALEIIADLLTGASLLGPLALVIGIICLLVELKVLG
jgi:formate-dependent nitrite reductase membrane component NrfD